MQRTRFPRTRPDAAKAKAWRAVKAALWQRAEGHCEVPWCNAPAQDPHHVTKRSQGGGDDLSNLLALCRRHHDQTDYALDAGRLSIKRWTNGSTYGFELWDGAGHAHSLGPFRKET